MIARHKKKGKGEQRVQKPRRGTVEKRSTDSSRATQVFLRRGNRLLSFSRRSPLLGNVQAACTRIKLSGEIETELAMLSRHADRGMRPPPAPTAVAASYQLVRNVLQRTDLRQPSRRIRAVLETCSLKIELPSKDVRRRFLSRRFEQMIRL